MTSIRHADEGVVTDLFPGARIRFVHGDRMTVATWEFEKDAEVAVHAHEAEQITHCLEGVLEIRVGDDLLVLNAGDTLVIPGGVSHSAWARTRAKGFDSFHPVREDYKF
ncbi:cupin domain-containing protein [Microbispora sp. H10670]|uniref:cupin domain-containing protein n=1 Tax=Microbispora sp. H10670 TaxID=2729108 RepID=UPI001603CF1B|nr:cupin domain-containing protein [Microbispora sp. H10670]